MAPDGTVLFINKTAASKKLSQSIGAERSRIFSHVQRSSSLNRPSDSKSPSISPRLKSGLKSLQDSEANNRPRTKRHRSRKIKPEGVESTEMSFSSSASSPEEQQKGGKRKLLDQLKAIIDPFASVDEPVPPCSGELLEKYVLIDCRHTFPIKSLAVLSWHGTISMAAKDPVLLSTLLATVSAAIYCATGDEEHRYAAMIYKGHALVRLSKKLSEPSIRSVEISSILAVSLLLWIECLHGDVQGLRAHISGLQQLLSRVDDISGAPLPVMIAITESCFLCSVYLRIQPMQKPTVMCADDIAPQTREALHRHISLSNVLLGHRFFAPTHQGIIGPGLLKLIGEQREVMLWKDLFSRGIVDPSPEEVTYVYTRQMVADRKLLSTPFEATLPSLTPAENAIRLALFTFGRPIILVARSSAAFPRAMVMQMKECLLQSDLEHLWDTSADMLLWILFIIAHLSSGQLEWEWCMSYIAQICRTLDLRSQPEVEEVLTGFYYFSEYFGETLDAAWRAIERRDSPAWSKNFELGCNKSE